MAEYLDSRGRLLARPAILLVTTEMIVRLRMSIIPYNYVYICLYMCQELGWVEGEERRGEERRGGGLKSLGIQRNIGEIIIMLRCLEHLQRSK